jgi:uncharacterized protein YggT (Ycf19 family)
MSGPLRYVFLAGTIYMLLILIEAILQRVDPREGTVAWALHRTLHAITEPYLRVIGLITPKLRRGSVDWRAIVGVTVLFIVLQVMRLVAG